MLSSLDALQMTYRDKISFKKILSAILCGILLTLSFPPWKLGWIAYFAFIPLLRAIGETKPLDSFKLGLIAGLTHYLTLIYWIVFVLGHYGGLNIATSICILLLFSFYLSLYPALFSLLVYYIKKAPFPLLLSAGIWVSLEYLRAKIFTGFPWCLTGYSQSNLLILIQIADIAGVYGVSFLIMSFNVLISTIIFNNPFKISNKDIKFEIIIIIFLIIATIGYGYYKLYNKVAHDSSVSIAIIQGNIDQSIKWDEEYQGKTLETLVELSSSVYDLKPDLIIWPETSVPFFFQDEIPLKKEILNVSRQSGADLIFGSPAYAVDGSTRYLNRVYALSPEGMILGEYDKVHLVPFGEYVPLKKFLPFVDRLVQAAGDFESGKEVTPIISSGISLGILICFEIIFPEISREQTNKGAKLLANLTNDAWFGKTSAPYQHLSMAVFRAVENRRPLVRAANTGFSAFIGPDGNIISRSMLFTKTVMVQKIGIDSSELTFYTQHGDTLIIFIIILSLALLFYAIRKRHRRTIYL